MKNFQDRVAVVTGGGSGIGEALCWRFARAGMKLVIADVDLAAAERVQKAMAVDGHDSIAVRTDVADAASVEAMADTAYGKYGKVDLLCNNAGVVPSGRHRAVWEYPLEDWKWAIDVNLMGVAHGLRSFVPRMLAQGTEGHIVTTASVAGLISSSGSPVYSAAKHGAVRITEALYASLLDRKAPIGVTLLCPGLVNTRIYESERNRPDKLQPASGPAAETPELQAIAADMYTSAVSPEEVAQQVFEAVQNNQFYVLTTSNFDAEIRERSDALLARRNPRFATLLELSKRDAQRESGKM